jgi:hypothetical protein
MSYIHKVVLVTCRRRVTLAASEEGKCMMGNREIMETHFNLWNV